MPLFTFTDRPSPSPFIDRVWHYPGLSTTDLDRMTVSDQITAYIDKLGDWRGKLVARLRALIRAASPELVEEWKWSTPVWSSQGNVLAVGAFQGHVKLNFFKGASLDDPAGLFNAGLDAKATRAIDLHQGDSLDEAALRDLVRAAVALNGAPARAKSNSKSKSKPKPKGAR